MKTEKWISVLSILIAHTVHASPATVKVAQEIKAKSLSGSASFSEMLVRYRARIQQFNSIALDKNLSQSQKIEEMNLWLQYAQREVRNQTGGSGISYRILSNQIQSMQNDLDTGNIDAPVKKVNATAGWILKGMSL